MKLGTGMKNNSITKTLLILTFLFLFVLVACKPDEEFSYPAGESIEIVNLGNTNILKVGATPLELISLITPSSAKQDVLWNSSDESIAIVTDGFVTGLRQGEVIITVTSVNDIHLQVSFTISVIDDKIEQDKINEVKLTLEELIPSEIDSNITLLTSLNGARITWNSSNYDAINRNGRVRQGRSDQLVTLSAIIKYEYNEGIFEKQVIVKKYIPKDLTNKKLVFTYLFDPNFSSFREGDLEKIDVINYSFGGIRNDNVSISLSHLDQVLSEAHKAGVRVVLAIGGWGVDGFSQACLTAKGRTTLVTSIIEAIQTYHFDGIDIDWEYPTATAGGLIGANPNDKANLTLFLKELRVAMDKLNPDLILSMAVAAGTYAANAYYEIGALSNVLDYLHIMTYDMINYSTYASTHHTNLYPSQYSNFSVTQAIEAYTSKGMPYEKIVVGAAFYGHLFKTTTEGVNGINAKSSTEGKGTVRYSQIASSYLNNPNFTLYYDEVAKASWLYGENTFISFDDPNSLAAKASYVLDNDLAGMMVWEYCQDDSSSTLLKAIYTNLKK